MNPTAGDLEVQLASKEREWKELQSLRVHQLESSLHEAQEELTSLRQRFLQLREDFRFNLSVLEERDRELERYDAVAARAKTTEAARQEEVSQLRIQVAKLQEQRDREAQEREEELRRSQDRAAQHRLQLERVQSSMAGDVQKQREENETLQRDLQRRIQEVEGELALQRQELTADFDHELRLREHEFNLRTDQMKAVVLSHELKVKLLSKETEVHSAAQLQAVEALQASEEVCQHTHTLLQHKEWELKDITALKDNRIKELEEELRKMDAKHRKEEEAFNRKHEELDGAVREGQAQLEALRGASAQRVREAEQHAARLQEELEAAAARTHRARRDQEETLSGREQQIQRLRTELETTRSGWDKYINQVSKETVAKDTELLGLQDRESKLRTELERSRGETERYKQQLGVGVERERALEQSRVQLELEWQRRCEDTKAQHYLASEGLIQGLTQARDQALAELQERQRDQHNLTVLLRTVTTERDQALQGTRPGAVGELPSEVLCELQQQNSSLRGVIAQMRRDMEGLSRTAEPPTQPGAPGAAAAASAATAGEAPSSTSSQQPNGLMTGPVNSAQEYSLALEEEVSELKARCRRLEEQLEGATAPAPPVPPPRPVDPDDAYLQSHIRGLNETIGGLRVEKVSVTAALRKQEVRVAHLESAVDALTQQCHSKKLEAEGLRLELANQKRSWSSEEAGLRQRLAAAEMELQEVRREKEEYQKGSILNNLESVALGNQVSALKLDIASRREPIVCQESEMVRQLQEENLCLRQRQAALGPRGLLGGKPDAPLLQARLRQAARCIARLTRDRQQLIEMGNGLRAQLSSAGMEVLQPSTRGSERLQPEKETSVQGLAGDHQQQQHQQQQQQQHHLQHHLQQQQQQQQEEEEEGRLSALQQLQYRLTTQELQYAVRDQRAARPLLLSPGSGGGKGRGRGRGRDAVHGASNPWTQGQSRQEPTTSKENTPPPPPPLLLSQSPSSSSPSGPPLLSSVATEGSLREVWQILDRGLSPSLLTEGEGEPSRAEPDRPVSGPHSQMREQNRLCITPVQTRNQTRDQAKRTAARTASHPAKNTRPGALGRASKIRNYNMKD